MYEFINFRSFIVSKEYEVEFFNNVMLIYSCIPIISFVSLLFTNAHYGKFQAARFTFLNLPGKLGWFIMESVAPATFLYSFLSFPFIDHNDSIISPYTTTQKILASLYLIHYFNRNVIYTYKTQSISSIHPSVFVSSILFNLITGYSNGRWISVFGDYSEEKCKEPLFIIGVLIFFIGMWINIEHDNILFGLRKKNSSNVTKSEKIPNMSNGDDNFANNDIKKKYFIPHEGLFKYVSCPNYLGETIEWIGFAIACWYSLPALLFALTTFTFLFHRASKTLKWYRVTFKEYPKERKAIIPFVW